MKDIAEKTEQELVKSLDLFDLELPDIMMSKEELAESRQRFDEAEKRLRPEYGNDWFTAWQTELDPDYPYYHKRMINEHIYSGTPLLSLSMELVNEWHIRMQELYGNEYKRLYFHREGDPEVVELLLQDALKTGKWQELPKCLHDEYKKRAFGRRRKK